MKVGGPAELFVCPEDAFSAAYVFLAAHQEGIPVFVLGGGSNLVVSDKGIQGIVLCTDKMNNLTLAPSKENDVSSQEQYAYVCADCGVRNNDTVEFCAENGLSGMESFSGLPGSAGGAAYMNARCYEVNISDRLHCVEFIELEELYSSTQEDIQQRIRDSIHVIEEINSDEWDYKKSPFMNRARFVTKVCFKCRMMDSQIFVSGHMVPEEIKKPIREKNEYFVEERRKRGHFEAPSAGSVFKNNRSFGKPSGALIDQAGLKGTQLGGAQVAPWHGNFIINNGNASAKDIQDLVQLVKDKVFESSGCMLECEIIFV